MNLRQMDDLREQAPEGLRCNTTIDFMSSEFGCAHLEQLFAMSEKPGMLPEHAHVAVLAEKNKAEKIASLREEVAEPVTAILDEAGAA